MVSTITRKLQPIEEDSKILSEMEQKMVENNWNIEILIDNSRERRIGVPDDLDSFVMTSRATPDDVAALASYIYTHSQVILLFFSKSKDHNILNQNFLKNLNPKISNLLHIFRNLLRFRSWRMFSLIIFVFKFVPGWKK